MSLIKFNTNAPVVDPFDQFFNDFFEGEFFPKRFANVRNTTLPAANIKQTDTAYHVELAAPGMKKDDFKIELEGNLLTIRSEQKEEHKETNERYSKREFNYTSFVRSFRLPDEVDAERIAASYTDGVLKLEIPKKEEVLQKQKVREISVK
jgi:HSP20 family protein